MAAAEPSSSESPPLLRRRARRLVFDRRYGWIFDEWTDPADQALSGGRGMFCVVPMAQSLVNAATSSVNHLAELEIYLNLLASLDLVLDMVGEI
ncbi:hypothetical protein EJB05_13134 [Eragrostis curvula]|uniref:Uncharacterized protein n=1 Tax=Eragrostis curvula TaxID=38414 RepID=A0A5J9VVN1_9POAL|nr:hypothetical protein EJB05_13134 [Eragrostis curvula]